MKYRRLGRTGLNVSVIGVGTWQLGGEWGKDFTPAEVEPMFRRAGDLGINLIDTAECYGDHVSESLVGQAIAGQRERWIIATKFGHKYLGFMKRDEPRTPDAIRRQLDDSLKALKTDYIDVYQYHSVRDSEFADPAVREMLQAQVKAGKIRHIGNSISGQSENLEQVKDSSAAHVEVLQVLYNRLQREPEARVLPECRRQDLGVLARVPLASGFLSGKYKPGATFDAHDTRSNQPKEKIEKWIREAQQIARDEVPAGVPMAQWALAWCLRNEAVTAVIPGCKSVEQVESNARAAEFVQTPHPLDAPAPAR